MAARNYLTIMTNIKAVSFGLTVLERYADASPNSLSVMKSLQNKGLKTASTAQSLNQSKTGTSNPNPFIDLENYLGVRPKEILYVANERQDIENANKAGMISVLVNQNQNLDYGQQFSVSSLDQLLDYL